MEDLLARLGAFHAQHPSAPGMQVKSVREALAPSLPLPAFESFMQELAASRRIVLKGGIARLPEHDAAANPADRELWERVYPLLLSAGIDALRVQELAAQAGVNERTLRDLLYRHRGKGAVYRVGEDRFCLRPALATLAATAVSLAQSAPLGTFTAAEFRDAIGVGRNLAIEILDCLDSVGVTLRVGAARRIRHDYVPLLGAATPVTRRPP
ncbi:MAG: SelB C-terminal domain-containing protein [Betaproteobacteria bacterium]